MEPIQPLEVEHLQQLTYERSKTWAEFFNVSNPNRLWLIGF